MSAGVKTVPSGSNPYVISEAERASASNALSPQCQPVGISSVPRFSLEDSARPTSAPPVDYVALVKRNAQTQQRSESKLNRLIQQTEEMTSAGSKKTAEKLNQLVAKKPVVTKSGKTFEQLKAEIYAGYKTGTVGHTDRSYVRFGNDLGVG